MACSWTLGFLYPSVVSSSCLLLSSFPVSVSLEPWPSSLCLPFCRREGGGQGPGHQPLHEPPQIPPAAFRGSLSPTFGLQGKLRPEVGAGVQLSCEEHSFCGWSSVLSRLPCRPGRGRGAWVPDALKGLNVLALSSLPHPGPWLLLPCQPTLPETRGAPTLLSITHCISPHSSSFPSLSPPCPRSPVPSTPMRV